MMTDVIADMLSRIRNAQKVKFEKVLVPYSRLKCSILSVLQEEGYIAGFTTEKLGVRSNIIVHLKYLKNRKSCIQEIKRISKPGRRVYISIFDLQPYKSGMGVHVLSTSKGVMSDRKAQELGIGGELLCRLF